MRFYRYWFKYCSERIISPCFRHLSKFRSICPKTRLLSAGSAQTKKIQKMTSRLADALSDILPYGKRTTVDPDTLTKKHSMMRVRQKMPVQKLRRALLALCLCAVFVFLFFFATSSKVSKDISGGLMVQNAGDLTNNDSAWSRQCQNNVTLDEYESLFPSTTNKYVLAGWSWACGGLGNQMHRIATLYGIGAAYGRKPIFTTEQRCTNSDTEGENEMPRLFPVYAKQLEYMARKKIGGIGTSCVIYGIPIQNPAIAFTGLYLNIEEHRNETYMLGGGYLSHCCRYDDPERVNFQNMSEKYVNIQEAIYLQHYKFFHHRRREIRQIFQFGPSICSEMMKYGDTIFKSDDSHKLCVHTRLGDFKQLNIASDKTFTENAITFAYNDLKQKYQSIAVVLLGADKEFLDTLKINKSIIPRVFVPKAMPRANDFVLATTACNSLLITTPHSTFSWWIAYLMPDGARVYFNAKFSDENYNRENFLPEWIPIKMDENNEKIAIEKDLVV